MRITIVAAALVTAALLPAHSRADSSQLYRCPDGMFTNRADLLCEPYETTGRVVIMPGGSNLAAVRPLLGNPRPVSRLSLSLHHPGSVNSTTNGWASISRHMGAT